MRANVDFKTILAKTTPNISLSGFPPPTADISQKNSGFASHLPPPEEEEREDREFG